MTAPLETFSTYEVSLEIGSVAAAAPLWQLVANAVAITRQQRIGLTRLEVVLNTATASRFALLAPNNIPVPLAPVAAGALTRTWDGNGGAGPAIGLVDSTWSTAPTFAVAPHNYLEMQLPGVVGASVVWTWPEDAPFAPFPFLYAQGALNQGICLRNVGAGASGVVTVNARWKEFY